MMWWWLTYKLKDRDELFYISGRNLHSNIWNLSSSISQPRPMLRFVDIRVQWWFVNPDTFVPGQYFRIIKFSGLLNRPWVQEQKSVPALFVRINEISGLSEPGLTNHHCTLLSLLLNPYLRLRQCDCKPRIYNVRIGMTFACKLKALELIANELSLPCLESSNISNDAKAFKLHRYFLLVWT